MYKILLGRFRTVFLLPRACTKSGWLEVDQELDMGCQLFDTNISVLKLQGSLAVVLWQHPSTTGTGRRAFFQFLGLSKISWKRSNSFVPVILLPHKHFRGDPVLVREFLFPALAYV